MSTIKQNSSPDAQYMLYSSGAIALSSFFGSILAGAILLSVNYRRLQRPVLGSITIFLGLESQICFFAVLLHLFPGTDNPMPGLLSLLLSPLVAYFVAKVLQDEHLRTHRDGGGRMVSLWQAVVVGISCLILFFLAALV